MATSQLESLHAFLRDKNAYDNLEDIMPNLEVLHFEPIPNNGHKYRVSQRLFLGDDSKAIYWATIIKYPKKTTVTELWIQHRGSPAREPELVDEARFADATIMYPWAAFFAEAKEMTYRNRRLKLLIQYAFLFAGHVDAPFPPDSDATFEQIFQTVKIIAKIYDKMEPIDRTQTWMPRSVSECLDYEAAEAEAQSVSAESRARSVHGAPSNVPTETQMIVGNNLITRGQQLLQSPKTQRQRRGGVASSGVKRGGEDLDELQKTMAKRAKLDAYVKELRAHLNTFETKMDNIDKTIDEKTRDWDVEDFRAFLKGKKKMGE